MAAEKRRFDQTQADVRAAHTSYQQLLAGAINASALPDPKRLCADQPPPSANTTPAVPAVQEPVNTLKTEIAPQGNTFTQAVAPARAPETYSEACLLINGRRAGTVKASAVTQGVRMSLSGVPEVPSIEARGLHGLQVFPKSEFYLCRILNT